MVFKINCNINPFNIFLTISFLSFTFIGTPSKTLFFPWYISIPNLNAFNHSEFLNNSFMHCSQFKRHPKYIFFLHTAKIFFSWLKTKLLYVDLNIFLFIESISGIYVWNNISWSNPNSEHNSAWVISEYLSIIIPSESNFISPWFINFVFNILNFL